MESGTLSSHPPPELLRGLASLRATGCLRLEHEGTTATVYFRDGLVYTASAPAARTRLGDRLVGAGHITEEQLADTLEHQRRLLEPRRIGELLIERGLIDRETMRTYVREQIADSVAATLRWDDGAWTFAEGEEVTEDAPLDVSVENLLMEGARRLEEWGIIEAQLGSVATVVDFAPDGSAAELSLTPDEWSMLTRIDGASTIAEIAEAAGYSQFEAARIIYGLYTAGVVSVVSEADAAPAEPPDTPEQAARVDGVESEPAPRHGHRPDLESAQPEAVVPESEDVFESADVLEPWDDAAAEPESVPPVPERGEPEDVPPVPWDPAEWDPSDSAGEPEPADRSGPGVDRNELLREFAALDEEASDRRSPRRDPDPPARRPVEPPPSEPPDRRERRGLFRRRRE